MTTDSPAEQTSRPRVFGQRDYTLPDSVRTNIPRQHYDGAPRLWAYARGLLIGLKGEFWPRLRACSGPTSLIARLVPESSGPTKVIGGGCRRC